MVVVTGKKLILGLILRKQTEDPRDESGGRVVQIRLITHDTSSLEHSKAQSWDEPFVPGLQRFGGAEALVAPVVRWRGKQYGRCPMALHVAQQPLPALQGCQDTWIPPGRIAAAFIMCSLGLCTNSLLSCMFFFLIRNLYGIFTCLLFLVVSGRVGQCT